MNFTFHNNVNWFLSLFRIYDSKTQSKKYNLIQFFPERVIWRLCRGLTPNFIIEQLRLPSRSFDRILFLFVLLFMFFNFNIEHLIFLSCSSIFGFFAIFVLLRGHFCTNLHQISGPGLKLNIVTTLIYKKNSLWPTVSALMTPHILSPKQKKRLFLTKMTFGAYMTL